jgi:hypothetical protein
MAYADRRWIFLNTIEKEHMMAYTLDSKVGEILDDPQAVAVLESYAPGASKNPMLEMAKDMTPRSIIEMPQAKQAGITEEMALSVLAEVNNLKK